MMQERKRRIRFHRKLSLIVALALGLLVAVITLKKSSVLPQQLSKYVNEHYLKNTGFRFSCDRVSGDFIKNVILENVVIEYRDKSKDIELFRSAKIEAEYSIMEVLKLNLVINNLMMDRTRVRLRYGEDGKLLLPILSPAINSSTAGSSPHIDLKKFSITNIDFAIQDSLRSVGVRNASISGKFRLENGIGKFEIENCSAFMPSTQTKLISLRMSADFSRDFLSLNNLIARLDRSYILVDGRYEDKRIKRLQVVFNPLNLKEISSLGLIPESEGEVGGSVIVSGKLDSLSLKGTLTGKALGFVFSGFSFEGRKTGGEIYLSSVEGSVFGAYVRGSLRYSVGRDGGYSFRGTCRDLDISEGFVPNENVPRTDIFGSVAMDYSRATDKYVFEADLDTSSIENFRAKRLLFKGEWTEPGGLKVNEIRFINPGFTVSGSGKIDAKGQTDMVVDLSGSDPGYIWEYLDLPRIKGELSLNGKKIPVSYRQRFKASPIVMLLQELICKAITSNCSEARFPILTFYCVRRKKTFKCRTSVFRKGILYLRPTSHMQRKRGVRSLYSNI
jgi:hypothetical protein